MYKKLGLCEGRHKIEGITEYIFPQEVNPLDLKGLSKTVHKVLADCTTLDLYVTGLTVALVEVINYATKSNIALTLWHYNRDTGKYFPQKLLSAIWRDELIEGGHTMKINKAKTSSYDGVTPRWIVEYIQTYAADINATANPGEADNSAIRTRLSNCNKNQLKAIAAELETVQKRLAWILHGQY